MNDTEILNVLKKHLLLFTYGGEATENGDIVQTVKIAGLSTGQADFELLKDWLNENCWKPKQYGKEIANVIFDEVKKQK